MGRAPELVLRSEAMEVVILPEAGARLHRVRAFGVDLLRTPDDSAAHALDPMFWGAYVMAPWCNRAAPGPMALAGRSVSLEPNFVDGSAIHGLVAFARWERRPDGELGIRRDAADDWPWAFEVRQRSTLVGAALEMTLQLVNCDPVASMPAGIGIHPWFRRPLEVRVPAERVYASNAGSPLEPVRVAGDLDLRRLAAPADGLDGTWGELSEPTVELAWPESSVRATLEVETDGIDVLVAVATPPEIDAIAVEPQTHGPDPLRRLEGGGPDAPALLPPGEALRLTVRLSVERLAGPH
jgi:galactose mutarotase-like enzyme